MGLEKCTGIRIKCEQERRELRMSLRRQ